MSGRGAGVRAAGQTPGVGLLAAWLVLFVACGPGPRSAEDAIERFLEAVQREDVDELFCRLAGAADPTAAADESTRTREEFESWATSRYADYLAGRDEGWVDLGDDGIVAVRFFALGRGTYYELRDVQPVGPDVLRARMDLRMGYQAIDLSGFSPGTTFYVCGLPPGRVHAIRKPAGRGEESLEVLDRISLEWTLVRGEPGAGCPPRWTVAAVVPIEGTATTRRVTWVF